MKKALTLSLVIPAYNEAAQIRACLEAVACQRVMPDEVIVVDNNSTDNTAQIAAEFPFVQVIQERRQGLRFSRDTGMAAATGDIIGRIDADTLLTPEWTGRAKRIFTDEAIKAATGPCYYHDMPAKRVGLLFDKNIRRGLFKLDTTPVLFGSNMVIRRHVWQQVQPLLCKKGEFFEDLDITIHLRDLNMNIAFNSRLVIGVSSRRLEDDPVTFFQNMQFYKKTFAMHGLQSPVATGGKYIYITTYPPLKLLRKAYDPDKRRLSLRKTFMPAAPRPTANT